MKPGKGTVTEAIQRLSVAKRKPVSKTIGIKKKEIEGGTEKQKEARSRRIMRRGKNISTPIFRLLQITIFTMG